MDSKLFEIKYIENRGVENLGGDGGNKIGDEFGERFPPPYPQSDPHLSPIHALPY